VIEFWYEFKQELGIAIVAFVSKLYFEDRLKALEIMACLSDLLDGEIFKDYYAKCVAFVVIFLFQDVSFLVRFVVVLTMFQDY
jgi:hypothetical protein